MRRAVPVLAGLLLLSTAAQARVTRIEILRTEPFAAGQALRQRRRLREGGRPLPWRARSGACRSTRSSSTSTRRRATRAARSNTSSDFYILRPADFAKGNGALLYDVNNRGNKRALIQFNSAPASNDPTTPAQAGNGFLMRQGFSVVWSGWIPGLPAANNDAAHRGADRRDRAGPIEQTVWDEFLFNDDDAPRGAAHVSARPRAEGATLLVRERNADAADDRRRPINGNSSTPQTIRLKPDGTAFRIGAIYQLIYKAANPPVSGIGFAATRDLVSFLRHDAADDAGTANPLAPPARPRSGARSRTAPRRAGAICATSSIAASTRTSSNRIVFDGINPHVATARLFLNQRFAQPNRMVNLAPRLHVLSRT